MRAVRARFGDRRGARDRREEKIDARAVDGRAMRAEADIRGFEAEAFGEFGGGAPLRPTAANAAE